LKKLVSAAFTTVGYGAEEGGNPKQGFTYFDEREYAVGHFNALGSGVLRLSQNVHTGNGGGCYGDSGGPYEHPRLDHEHGRCLL
jgi:hypothetical protein